MILYVLSDDLIHGKRGYMSEETKQIGLDRLVLTVKATDVVTKGDDVPMLDINDGAIVVRPNALHRDLIDIMVNAPKLFNGTNEKNLTVEQMYNLTEIIQKQLEEHGVLVDVARLKLGSFEVNYNVNDKKFYDVLQLIAKANINDNLKAFKVENKDGIQSVKIKKQRYNLKVYKKSEHLEERFECIEEEHLVRFEVATNSDKEKQKIMQDDLTLIGLIENWERVEEWYRNCIKLTVKKPIEKYVEDMEKQILTMLEAGIKPNKVIETLMFREDLIDLLPFENAMKKHYKKIGNTKNVSRGIKTAHNRLKKLDEERYNEVVGNIQKLEELYELINLQK